MLERTLRWGAICLVIATTLVFVHLGVSVAFGQTSELFSVFLNIALPPEIIDGGSATASTAREQLAMAILNYGITALGTIWVACVAYLIVMRNQQRQTEQQLSIERLRLIAELDQRILEIFDSESVFDLDADGQTSLTKFISACDRNTTWRIKSDREWNYRYGERTTRFVETSKAITISAEISLTVLHQYLGWMRRIARAIETHVLSEKDVLLFWRWVVIGCYKNRYPFMCSILFEQDMQDFVRIVDKIIISGEKYGSGKDFLGYLVVVGDPLLISKLSVRARSIIEKKD